jgi:hypothetical protein
MLEKSQTGRFIDSLAKYIYLVFILEHGPFKEEGVKERGNYGR